MQNENQKVKCVFIIILLSFFISSCAFDNLYLAPEKIPATAERATIIDYQNQDTLIINIGEEYQPTFTDTQGDTLDLGYKIESVLFENSIENLLNGWIITPNGKNNGKTILFMHGNAGNLTTQYTGVVPLVKRGFTVFIFDYSGFGFSEGEASRENVLQDGTAALKYLLERKDIDQDELIIYGQSLGGHLATIIAAENEADIDALVIEGAFSSHKDIAAETAGFIGRILVAEMYSGLESIKDFNKPVLIIHSKDDQTVPISHGQKLFEHANKPKIFFEIDKCHICGLLYYPDKIVNKIKRMIGG